MHSIHGLSIEEWKSYSKCAQLYSIIYDGLVTHFTAQRGLAIVKKEGDASFIIPSDSLIDEDDMRNGNILHIAWIGPSGEITKELLNQGANFTLKSENGDTPLHRDFSFCSSWDRNNYFRYQEDSHINAILSAHVKFANPLNPSDNNGFTHFHIACLANHTKAVELFLLNGVDVNLVSGENSYFPGYTPLHCAVYYCGVETVKILLKFGADRSTRNANGTTPLQEILKQRIELFGSTIRLTRTEIEILPYRPVRKEETKSSLYDRLKLMDRIIFMLMGSNFLEKVNILDSTGLSSFHIACTMQDSNVVKNLLKQVQDINHCVNMDSPVWPGYTAIHFAALCNNTSVIELLLRGGSNIDVKNARGITAFDICLKMGYVEDIHVALSLQPKWANILFSDNKTRLLDFIFAMQNTIQLNDFLRDSIKDINIPLPNNSVLWPGCTALHLAVIISNKYMKENESDFSYQEQSILEQIKLLLTNGADVTCQDISGRTPLHLAFQQRKRKIVKLLLQHHNSSANPVDEDNFSHLHIACKEDDENVVEKILSNNQVDVNITYKGKEVVQEIRPGWTPLDCSRYEIKKKLLARGANAFPRKERQVEDTLHSACSKDDKDSVQRLMKLGTDVNFVSDYGLTPLHVAVSENSLEVIEVLLQRGADLFAKNGNDRSPFSLVFQKCSDTKRNEGACKLLIYSTLKQDEELQRRLKTETGITMLHIACYMLDIEEVKNQLVRGVEINAQTLKDSDLWPGCTPLHILMIKVMDTVLLKQEVPNDVNVLTEYLLENGADVTLANADNNSPVHISYDCNDKFSGIRTSLLLKHHRNFRINPVCSKTISHFHLTVMLDEVEIAEKFLKHGVNVNQPIDYFAETFYGCTPLHMAIYNLRYQRTVLELTMIDLLLSYGADVNLDNTHGRSALHKATKIGSLRLHLMKKLLSHGANIHCIDWYGKTPFESLLRSKDATAKDIQLLLQHGARVNIHNPVYDEGYLGLILSKEDYSYRNMLFDEAMKAPNVDSINELGRTLIHNVVAIKDPEISSREYIRLFNRFKQFGHDIDDQDRAGQTALHLASQFGNNKAISALLTMGADLNIVDFKGKSALSYATEFCLKCNDENAEKHYHDDVIFSLVLRIFELKSLVLDVSELNNSLVEKSLKIMKRTDINVSLNFVIECNMAKNLVIEPLQLTLKDFLSETDAVIKYHRMSELERDVIDFVFETVVNNFISISPILKLQHRKAITRFQLVETISFLQVLVGFPLPDLCAHNILRFLNLTDLKNIVAATN